MQLRIRGKKSNFPGQSRVLYQSGVGTLYAEGIFQKKHKKHTQKDTHTNTATNGGLSAKPIKKATHTAALTKQNTHI